MSYQGKQSKDFSKIKLEDIINLNNNREFNDSLDLYPNVFNYRYPNGIEIKGVKRNHILIKKLHPHNQKGIIYKAPNSKMDFPIWISDFEICSIIISRSEYRRHHKCNTENNEYNIIDRFTDIKGDIVKIDQNGISEKAKPLSQLKFENSETVCFSGMNNINQKENDILIKHVGVENPIRISVYFGRFQQRLWFMGYFKITRYKKLYFAKEKVSRLAFFAKKI